MKKIDGVTAFVSVGRWGGFYLRRRSVLWRLCLGFVSLTVVLRDDEFLVEYLNHKRKCKEFQ